MGREALFALLDEDSCSAENLRLRADTPELPGWQADTPEVPAWQDDTATGWQDDTAEVPGWQVDTAEVAGLQVDTAEEPLGSNSGRATSCLVLCCRWLDKPISRQGTAKSNIC